MNSWAQVRCAKCKRTKKLPRGEGMPIATTFWNAAQVMRDTCPAGICTGLLNIEMLQEHLGFPPPDSFEEAELNEEKKKPKRPQMNRPSRYA